jgi:TonB-linked SusC/RagA family outer membrane protein
MKNRKMKKLPAENMRLRQSGITTVKRQLLFFCMVLFPVFTYAQSINVKGQVKDIYNDALPGVNVIIKGTTTGVVTDPDGQYSINVASGNDILEFSFVGFEKQDVVVGNQIVINITLKESVVELEEAVVVGYGTQKKVSLVGAVSGISVKQLEQVSTPSLSTALNGKLPGIISKQSSGEPGADQTAIYIRGMASWVNSQPLILVDGVERDMNTINTQEIESFSILKDASATAVYGVMGANGVILINTRKGSVGKPTVTLRSEVAALSPVRVPKYINGPEYADFVNEARVNRGEAPRYTPDEIQKFGDGSDPYLYPNVNWWNELMKARSFQTINNLNVSGGSEIIRYFVNVGYTMQDGMYKADNLNAYNTNANLQRYNFRSRVDLNLAKNFTIDLSIGGIVQQRNYPANDSPWFFNSIKNTTPIAFPARNPDGTPGATAPDANLQGLNPWAVLTQQGYRRMFYSTIQSTFGARWDLSTLVTQGLSLSGKFSYDFNSNANANRSKMFEIKQYLGKDSDTGEDQYVIHREATPLGYAPGVVANRAYYMESIINYDRSFGKHGVTGMFLYNQRDLVILTAGTSTANLPYRTQGVAGRLTYDFDRRYFAEFNFGYNGSENFPKGQRFGFFPSVSAGWVISGESFWKVPVVSHIKLRGSYGQAGNDRGESRFLYLTKMNLAAGNNYYYGMDMMFIDGIEEGQTGSKNVTWEVSTKMNVGIDLEMFKGALRLQADVFRESRTGILIQRRDIPTMAGFYGTMPFGNLGEARNKGIDGLLEFRHTLPSGLYISLRSNLTYAKNIIIENDEPKPKYPYQSGKNLSINQGFGLIASGFFKDEDDVAVSPRQTFMSTLRAGDVKYVDVNSDGVIDSYDQVPIGYSRVPELMYGFGGTVVYKGFDISIYFTGAGRTNFLFGGTTMNPFYNGEHQVLREYYDHRWINGTDNTNVKYPRVINENNDNNYLASTLWMRNGNFIRLKNAEIGYTVPASVAEKVKMKEARIFINGINLYTWDHIKIFDPESDSMDGGYPIQRTLNLGIQITF